MSNKINMKTVDGLEEALASKSNPIGSIITSTIPLNDAGLHLADGALISGSGSYADFVDYMAGLVSTNPEIFASGYESETSVGSAISGGDYSGYPKGNAFDGSTSTFWGSSQLGPTNIVGHAYIGRSGLTKPVKKVRMMQGYNNSATNNYCSQLLFQYSNDGTTWIDITSISDGANLTWQEWVLPDYTPTGDTHSFRVLAYGGFSGGNSNNWDVAELELYYWDANSESVWQSSVSTYGVCGKYVYDSVNNTIRLPKIEGFIEGILDPTKLGDLTEAGLPNITGSVNKIRADSGTVTKTGALNMTVASGGQTASGVAINAGTLSFNASLSNSIYGNSNTVQPQAIKVFYYVVIATSTKTVIEVDIDEIATDLNGKADVDASNFNASGKSLLSGLGMPSNSGIIDLIATGQLNSTITTTVQRWICPKNGWIKLGNDGTTPVWCSGGGPSYSQVVVGSPNNNRGLVPLVKGTTIEIQTSTGTATLGMAWFYPCEGEK